MMTVDYSKFAVTGIENPHAATLTEAITYDPVDNGYIIVTLKTGEGLEFADRVRSFAQDLRADATATGMTEFLAYREARPDELGGSIPFEQAICDNIFADARRRHETQEAKYPAAKMALQVIQSNDMADWVLLIEYRTPDQAKAAADRWAAGDTAYQALTAGLKAQSVNAFRNIKRYAHVSRDPNTVHFFNLFPGPGDASVLWVGWQEAAPYFIEVGEFRSSFPLIALDNSQPLLIVNYAHCDTVRHFFLSVVFDPNMVETIQRCYADRGFHLPLPFFCKIVPV